MKPAQASPSRTDKAAQPASASSVNAGQSVITVHETCAASEQKKNLAGGSCDRVMTREKFESLLNALNPGGQVIPAKSRQALAQAYAEFVALEAAAKRDGAEDSPQFREILEWVRLRTTAELYRRSLQEKFRNPAPEEIDAHYRQHLADFERVKLARILVPREDISAPDRSAFDKKARAAANSAHDRAARGEDPDAIQKDVYASLGLQAPPPTNLGRYARSNFTAEEGNEVFALKPGETSHLQIEPKNYVIYKVISKETLPEEEVKTDIARQMAQAKFNEALKAITESAPAEFNTQYFGPEINAKTPGVALPATPPVR
jgi:parvulin-like peptidyl-prolyl isomerase